VATLLRLVVDTNIWISALLNPHGMPARVRRALEEGLFTLVMSEPLVHELEEVLARPRFVHRYHVTADIVADLVALLRERSDIVAVDGSLRLCRDPDDDVVIETALNGHADALVSRDDDLKAPDMVEALKDRGIRVVTVRQLLEVLAV
jgi:putative PIN family toxin of toxin-antitoxin system